jgi:hypothetical protein
MNFFKMLEKKFTIFYKSILLIFFNLAVMLIKKYKLMSGRKSGVANKAKMKMM